MHRTTHHVPDQSQENHGDDARGESKIVALRLRGRDYSSAAPPDGDSWTDASSKAGVLKPIPDLLVTIPELFAQPLQNQAGPALTPADQRWFAALTTRWVLEGSPANLRVYFAMDEALELLGRADGQDSRLGAVRASALRLRAATVESRSRRPSEQEGATVWGLLERASVEEARGRPGQGWVELNRQVAELLEEAEVTYLHAPTWDRIRERDEVASRLWVFLETQEMPTLGRRYELFSSPVGGEPRRRTLPVVSELAGVGETVLRRQTVDRIRHAIRALVQLDPRYVAQVVKAGRPGMWRLEVRRRSLVRRPERPES